MNSESMFHTGFLISAGSAVALSIYLLTAMRRFFSRLEAEQPAYYKEIGSPTYKIGDFKHRISAAMFMFRLFLGIRKDFPQDKALRRQMRLHQVCLYLMTIGVAIGVGMMISVS